jgi:hypothetical protein
MNLVNLRIHCFIYQDFFKLFEEIIMNLSILLPMLFSASVVSAEAPKYVEGEVIVKFKTEGLRSQDISALQNQFSIASAKRLSGIGVQLW